MAVDRRTAAPVRWRSFLVEEPPALQPEPVPVLVSVHALPHVWLRELAQVRPLPDFDRWLPANTKDVLGGGGRWLVLERITWSEDESIPYLERRVSLGVHRYSFATGALDRAGFDPLHGGFNRLHLAGSPDGTQVLIAQHWLAGAPDRPKTDEDARMTLSLAGFDGSPPRELLTMGGGATGNGDDQALQWSPDGTRIAASVSLDQGPGQRSRWVVLVLDASTGREVARHDGALLCGSVSWSPDSERLLVQDETETTWVLDTATGTREAIPFLPGRRPGVWVNGSLRPLGFADPDHLMVATQRGATMTLSAVHLTTSASRPLVRWAGSLDMYPRLATMPAGYWDLDG